MSDSRRAEGLALAALGGEAAPAKLAEDLGHFARFSPEARRRFWSALGPSLDEPITKEAERALDAYCAEFALDEDALAQVVSAARFLVREASRRRLSQADLEADLRALVGDEPGIVGALAAGYKRALVHLSQGYAARSVVAHGRILKQIDWRLERIVASNEARVLDVPIGRMTLTTDGPEGIRSVSLQLDMATVRKLRDACEAIEAAATGGGAKKRAR